MDGIAPGAATTLRAHLSEVEACWLEARCASCGSASMIPFRLLVRQYGPEAGVGACVSLLKCKRCAAPPSTVRVRETPHDHHPSGGPPAWSQLIIDRTAQPGQEARH